MDVLFLAVRATGGHKYRKAFKGTDQEVNDYIAGALPKIQAMFLALIVAEDMLQEPCTCKPSLANLWKGCPHKRWQEYLDRKQALIATIKAKFEADAKKIPMQLVEKPAEEKA